MLTPEKDFYTAKCALQLLHIEPKGKDFKSNDCLLKKSKFQL